MNLKAKIGELRGEFISEKRFKAFKEKYNRDPMFYGEKASEEFGMMKALVDDNKIYLEFENLIKEQFNQFEFEHYEKIYPFHFRGK